MSDSHLNKFNVLENPIQKEKLLNEKFLNKNNIIHMEENYVHETIYKYYDANETEIVWQIKKHKNFFYNISQKIKKERGIIREELNFNYLFKKLQTITLSLPSINEGKNSIINALENKKKIGIIGDYDVDGICSTALLYKFLNNINHPVEFFIGDREDGYGPTNKAFDYLRCKGCELIIVLDSGTVAKDILDVQKEEIIVLDHHIPDDLYKPANAIVINPQLNNHEMAMCCTGGLVFAFIYCLKDFLEQKNIKVNYQDLITFAGLTTVCDVMPLTEINSIYVYLTVEAIKNENSPALFNYLILNKHKKKKEFFNEEDLGFFIGPHINSVGRLCSNKIIHQLVHAIASNTTFPTIKKDKLTVLPLEELSIIANSDEKIIEFINCVEKSFFPNGLEVNNYKEENFIKYIGNLMINLNCIRKERQKILIEEIASQKELISNNKQKKIFPFYSNLQSSFLGIVGIIAAKICEDFNKLSIIGVVLKDKIKGSIRSIDGINVGEMMIACKEKKLIIDGGGHAKAGGFTVSVSGWNDFINFCDFFAAKSLLALPKHKIIDIDYILSIAALNRNLMDDLQFLRPFGEGNNKLKFLLVNCNILGATVIKGNFLLLTIETEAIKYQQKKRNVACWCFFYKRNEKFVQLLNKIQKKDIGFLDMVVNVSDLNEVHLIDFREVNSNN